MSGISLREAITPFLKELTSASHAADKIDSTNVYQEANPKTKMYMDKVVAANTLPQSHLEGRENFINFYEQVKAGKRGLILMEHYSNTDLPSLFYQLEKDGDPRLAELSKHIVAIAGMKLNEADPTVKAFAEGFTRVVIYPTRSLSSKEESNISEEEKKAEEQRARKINLAAMRAMDECKKRGDVILVFPTGTRYRPGRPETKKGLREIDSYLRLFDIVILVSINGCCLTIQDEDMLNDLLEPVNQIMAASPVIECKPFRTQYMDSLPADEPDPKQKMIDHIMDLLEEQHNKYESLRESK